MPTFETDLSVANKDFQINDIFWTLQGEGVHSGQRALFVRLPYCNYDCPWCDTEYNSFKKVSETEFAEWLNQEPARLAVITGGEPMVHKDLPRILELLKEHNFYVACETNGSAPIPEGVDFVTCSPKAFTKGKFQPYYVHPDAYQKTKQWKYVVDDNFDFKLLERHKDDPTNVVHALSPEFGEMQKNSQLILEFIKLNPRWRLSLQTHKWIDIP